MDETLIEDSQHDVDSDQRAQNEDRLIGTNRFECRGCSLKAALNAYRYLELFLCLFYSVGGLPQGISGRDIKGDRDDRELALMRNGKWRRRDIKMTDSRERNRRLRRIRGAAATGTRR